MIRLRLNLYSILHSMVLLYAFSTITQNIYPFSLNRLWTAGIIICLLSNLLSPMRKGTFANIFAVTVCALATTVSAGEVGKNTDDLIYFVTSVLWFLFMTRKENREKLYNAFFEHQRMTKNILMASYLSVAISLLSGSGYAYQWGNTAYYIGFAGTQHTMASSMCVVTSVFLIYSLHKKFSWLSLAVFMFGIYAIFETGARTFIIPILILMFYYIRHNIKNLSIKTVAYSVGVIGVMYVVQHSSMMDKFNFVSSGGNMATTAMQGFTSGRSLFWAIDLNAYASGTILQIIFGRGFDFVYGLNARMVNQRIWAHNDFVHLLLGGGLVAFGTYVYVVYNFYRNLLSSKGRIDKAMLIIYFLFPALINGFFMYQHLLLSMMILCLCSSSIEKKVSYSLNTIWSEKKWSNVS